MLSRREDPPIKITREIPLWGVLGVVATIIGQAAVVWFTQKEQGAQLVQVISELRQVTDSIRQSDVRNERHELKIEDLQRRVQALEQKETRH